MSLNNSCVRLLLLFDFALSTPPASVSPRDSTRYPPPSFPAIHNLGVQKHYSHLYQTLHAIFSDVFLNWCPSSTPVTFTHFAPSRLIIPLSLTLFSIPLFHHLSPHHQPLNPSLFNQHPLNFNIQAHPPPQSDAPSVFIHLFPTALTILPSRGIIFPINHPPLPSLSIYLFQSPLISRATFPTIHPNQ